ncbi:MAG: hypothetical protein WBQ37_15445 [Candidatus Competibacter sp.]
MAGLDHDLQPIAGLPDSGATVGRQLGAGRDRDGRRKKRGCEVVPDCLPDACPDSCGGGSCLPDACTRLGA